MAKSKLIIVNQKIAERVTKGYKKIENGVIEGFRKMSNGVASGYTKIEDGFVNHFLTKEGETVDEAKVRLKREQEELKKKNEALINR